MSSLPVERDRRMVPRWRPSTLLFGQVEARPLFANPSQPRISRDELRDAHAAWLSSPTIELAAEVVISSATADEPYLAFGPAEQLIKNQHQVAPPLVALAREVRFGRDLADCPEAPQHTGTIFSEIGRLRIQLRSYARDPFAWLDLALLYTRIGQHDAAIRAARTSLGLAPENRLIVRSNARLLLHFNDPNAALKLVRRSELAPHDPWLAGLEIELADIAGKSPRLFRQANELLRIFEDRPEVVTELAASLGTSNALHGSIKLARANFRRALQRPNENVVAQARWVSGHVPGSVQFDGTLLQEEERFEARAQHYYQAGNWSAAIIEIEKWLNDEPFSSRPAALGSFVAGSLMGEYERAAEIAERGLVANQHDLTLLNNSAFALAMGPTPKKALRVIDAFPSSASGGEDQIFLTATRGLVEMKVGDEDVGRRLYEKAIDAADTMRAYNHAVLARLHFVITELESRLPSNERVIRLLSESLRLSKHVTIERVVLNGIIARIARLTEQPRLPFDDAERGKLSDLTNSVR